ncbi:TIGR01210 family radical SAM protein [Candidatus Thorarchaeota archaeon]|nr:MAG: TIGR01210 family radical SAM protein [Candidatus Thorarchaeota archaeon]
MMDNHQLITNAVKQAALKARGKSITKRKSRDPTRPSAAWTAPSRIGTEIGTSLSIVLSTIGCAHARSDEGGCTMCSYLLDGTSRNPTSDELVQQFRLAMTKIQTSIAPLSIKIYTSGSFLDNEEIPIEAHDAILHDIAVDDRVKEVVLESRPEYVLGPTMASISEILGDRIVEIGMGLESSSDFVRTICINKNFSLESFNQAVKIAKNFEIGTRAYVLLKPPFMTERDALIDSQQTMNDAINAGVSSLSFNPVTVQSNTLVEFLWKRGKYRPPWLWSVIDVLKYAKGVSNSRVNIVCDPVAAGKQRGTHNCGECDTNIVAAIRKFSLDQNVRNFENLTCDCKNLWFHGLEHEDVSLVVHR